MKLTVDTPPMGDVNAGPDPQVNCIVPVPEGAGEGDSVRVEH